MGAIAIPGASKPASGGGGSGGSGGVNQHELGEEPTEAPAEAWTPEEAEDENKRQQECAAQKYGEEVASRGSRGNEVEHFSVTWRRDGQNVTSEVREATGRNGNMPVGSSITRDDYNNLSRDYGGIPRSDVTGFNHNHPSEIYCNGSGLVQHDRRQANQRPSLADWNFADAMTNNDPTHGLVLYVRDCEGAIRAFPYANNQGYRNGSIPTPDPISPDCTATED